MRGSGCSRAGPRPLLEDPRRDRRSSHPDPGNQPAAPLSPAPALDSAAAADLTDALCEFDAVLADFASPFHERHFHYEEHLERMKRRSSASVSDSSGFSDTESKDLASVCLSGSREGSGDRVSGRRGRVDPGRLFGAKLDQLSPAGVPGLALSLPHLSP